MTQEDDLHPTPNNPPPKLYADSLYSDWEWDSGAWGLKRENNEDVAYVRKDIVDEMASTLAKLNLVIGSSCTTNKVHKINDTSFTTNAAYEESVNILRKYNAEIGDET